MDETDYDILIALAGADGHSSSVYGWLLGNRNRDIIRGIMAPYPFVGELHQRLREADACIDLLSKPWRPTYRPGTTIIRFAP